MIRNSEHLGRRFVSVRVLQARSVERRLFKKTDTPFWRSKREIQKVGRDGGKVNKVNKLE